MLLSPAGAGVGAELGKNSPGKREKRDRNPKFTSRRCGTCAGCLKQDCGTCLSCRDKKKFGGRNKRRHACDKRRCLEKARQKQESKGDSGQEDLERTLSNTEDEWNQEDQGQETIES